MKVLRFNDTIIKSLSEGEYRDSQYHFLYLRVGKIKKTWYFLRTINSKTCRKKSAPSLPSILSKPDKQQ